MRETLFSQKSKRVELDLSRIVIKNGGKHGKGSCRSQLGRRRKRKDHRYAGRESGHELRRRGGDGGEFGATTGRPRRMGWFDCVATKYGCRLQGATDVAFTVLDALGYLEEIPVCVGYEIDGEVTTDFPVTYKLEKAKPVLKKLPGWKCDIRGIRKFEDLPENCRKYVEFIEEQIGFPITMVSNGPGREDIIYRESPLKK